MIATYWVLKLFTLLETFISTGKLSYKIARESGNNDYEL